MTDQKFSFVNWFTVIEHVPVLKTSAKNYILNFNISESYYVPDTLDI